MILFVNNNNGFLFLVTTSLPETAFVRFIAELRRLNQYQADVSILNQLCSEARLLNQLEGGVSVSNQLGAEVRVYNELEGEVE